MTIKCKTSVPRNQPSSKKHRNTFHNCISALAEEEQPHQLLQKCSLSLYGMLISTQKLFVKHNISKHTFHKQGSLQKVVTRSFVASRIFIFFKTSEEEGFWHLLGSIRIRRAAALKKSLVVMVPLANCDRSRPKWCSIRISDKECELFQGYQKGDLQVKIASVVNAICCMLLFVWPAICIFPLGHLKLFSR